ncbi:MAG: recombinase family protein [Patescibacteria group bacterium]
MKGIIYTRVSSEEQVKGTSLDFQEEVCRNYCRDKGIEVLALFREEGASAKTADRGEFLRAIEYCRKNKGKVEAFVVAKVDRFARNTEDHFYVRKILLDYGVTLHSVSEPIGNSPVGKFFETMLAGSSEFDNAIRKQRCTDGMLARLRQGIWPWNPPPGYKPGNWTKRREKKLRPDQPDEQLFPIIQRALKEYAKGLCSQVELAGLMDEWGFKEARGRKTPNQFIDRMLGRYLPFYAGTLVNPWTGEEIDGLHKAMITKDEMEQIKFVRSGKSRLAKRERYNPEFPLRRTVICATCAVPLTGSAPRGNGGRYLYYHCKNKKCLMFGKSITKKVLETEFLRYLETITPNEKWLAVFKETVLDLWEEQGKGFDVAAQRYQRQLALLETKRKRIYEMREDSSYTKEEFLERRQEVDNEIAATKISMNESRIEQFDIEGALTYAIKFIRNLGRQWFDLPPQIRPRFQKLLFPDGLPYRKGLGFGTARLGLIYKLKETSHGEKSLVVAGVGIEPTT